MYFVTQGQVILGYGVSSDRNDTNLLKPMLEEVKERTGRKPEVISTDSGYGTRKNYRYLKKEGIVSYIPYPSYEQERMLKNKGLFVPPQQNLIVIWKSTNSSRDYGYKVMKAKP